MKTFFPLTQSQEDVLPILSAISIFNGLNAAQLQEVLKLLKTADYEPGEFIYKRGEPSSHIYIILKGEVKMQIGKDKRFLEFFSFKKGDCFGETSVIGIQSHSLNALAMEPTELIVLEPASLLNIFETDKGLFGILILNIARETARRLHHANESLAQYMLTPGKTGEGR